MNALFDWFPQLHGRIPWVSLGELPTPVEEATRVLTVAGLPGELWLKRDDLSSPVCGGNKLRLLEHLLGEALERGAQRVYSTGAVGSNFALATALHAPRVGLEAGALCFPQPLTSEGEHVHRVVTARASVVEVSHWSLVPWAAERVRRAPGRRVQILSQVALSAENLLGYLSAGLELAAQIAAKDCPAPRFVVLPIGSAATSAGILAGLSLARKLGRLAAVPTLCPVRIAAWPLSRRGRVLALAQRALAGLARLLGDASVDLGKTELLPMSLVTDQLGRGYPHGTAPGHRAIATFRQAGYPILDETYSAKAAAHALSGDATASGPVLFWCTKSSAPLPRLS